MKYVIKNLDETPLEGTHDLPNSRQTLLNSEEILTGNFQAFTKGILESGKTWDWHSHDEHYEFFTVLQGEGIVEFEDSKKHEYKKGDVVLVHPGYKHRILASGNTPSEFFFVRLK